MATVDEVFSALREFPTVSERGTAFEKLMVRFLLEDKTFSDRFETVTRWDQWEYNGGRADTGIDLVAKEKADGSWTAIQCKFYEPSSTLRKSDLDSFYTESGKKFPTERGEEAFAQRMIISTTDKWSVHAEGSLENQSIPVQRIGAADLADSSVNWDVIYPGAGVLPRFELERKQLFTPRPHQQTAIDKTIAGFHAHDRGKLIMACGTGKTFTSLRLVETLAQQLGGRVRVLFLVPSISLLSQSLKEWHAQAKLDIRSFAVCSDNKVSRAVEDIATYDLEIPVTTDGGLLAEKMARGRRSAGISVVFSTYQSLPVVEKAQAAGADDFDIVICDEAHRTTGITVGGEDSSNFVKIHDPEYIAAARRLYMTATPRLFDEKTKDKASDHSAEVASMDDEGVYGPEFHRLGFGEAVEKGLLTDYKVLVLTVDQQVAARTTAQIDGEIPLDDVSRLIGCWTGVAKRSGAAVGSKYGFADNQEPMKRAVAFARDIKTSQRVAENFPEIASAYSYSLASNAEADQTNVDTQVQVQHVDGSMNAMVRGDRLRWLKAPVEQGTCRVLTNARCLSEGVDVPALDAVMFLNPRNSQVDVVQSVGRVMRKSEGKDYGYIILPVGVPEGVSPSEALANNKRFQVVWQVLNALRSHDDRFDATVNSAIVNSSTSTGDSSGVNTADSALTDKIRVEHIGLDNAAGDESHSDEERAAQSRQYALFSLEDWQDAIYTRIVNKVGDRTYWEDWANDVADIAQAQIARITDLVDHADEELAAEFDKFVEGLRANLNDSITPTDAISMLSQHLITAPVFDALFAESGFAQHNPVSKVMTEMINALNDSKLESETEGLDKFYRSVRVRASEVTSAAGKQEVVKDLYERFFKKAFSKQAEALGIVYTPVELVDFILRAADDAMRMHLGKSLSDKGVHIQDPFTGTGMFIVRLLQSGLIKPEDLARKYASELWATEIMLLAYYVAAVNIEVTFNGLMAERSAREQGVALDEVDDVAYQQFDGIVLGDTFQMSEDGDTLDLELFVDNNERATRQLEAPMRVIIGNPPYSAKQSSANDLNANVPYPTLDARIGETYVKLSTATLRNSLYDSYLRAFRWATDRIGGAGVVAFVSNGGWLDGNTAEGVRLSFERDFNHIYVYNLRGNQRGDWRREGGKVFGEGSQTAIVITIGVKIPGETGCSIHYRDIGDYLTAEEKLAQISTARITDEQWRAITPNIFGDWLSQRSKDFGTWPVIGDKKNSTGCITIFDEYSGGLKTNRDVWVYNYDHQALKNNVEVLLDTYNQARQQLQQWLNETGIKPDEKATTGFLKKNSHFAEDTSIKWTRGLRTSAAKNKKLSGKKFSVASLYRPFTRQNVVLNYDLIEVPGKTPRLFPSPAHTNIGIDVAGLSAPSGWFVLAAKILPDVQLVGNGQFFARFQWEPAEAAEGELDLASAVVPTGEFSMYGQVGEIVDGYRRVDNITDAIAKEYRAALGADVSRDDIFHYIYGVLHDPNYRKAYAADLKKMLPHIETPTDRHRFNHVALVGKKLMDLHVDYEDADPYPLKVELKETADPEDRETWRVQKMKWGKVRNLDTKKLVDDQTTIIYNSKVTITGIPPETNDYLLGSRSALAWVIDQYQVTKDKKSGIVNDPNAWADEHGNPQYIIDLIKKVTTVSIETMRLMASMDD